MVNIKKIKDKEKVLNKISQVQYMKVNLKITNLMEKEHINLKMEKYMKVNLKMILKEGKGVFRWPDGR